MWQISEVYIEERRKQLLDEAESHRQSKSVKRFQLRNLLKAVQPEAQEPAPARLKRQKI